MVEPITAAYCRDGKGGVDLEFELRYAIRNDGDRNALLLTEGAPYQIGFMIGDSR